MEDLKRNSALILAHCMHNLDKEFEKAGLAKYSVELRQKFENSLKETFDEIDVSGDAISSQEFRAAAAISNPPAPTPCSPYYIPSSPSYAYESCSPGNVSCSPYYTPSSPFYNPYYPEERVDNSAPTTTEETFDNVSSKSRRMSESSDSDQKTDLKKIKLDTDDYAPPAEDQQDDSVEDINCEGHDRSLENEGFDVTDEILEQDV